MSKTHFVKSWFGRLFGQTFTLVITAQGLQVSTKTASQNYDWQQLQQAPEFAFGWLGCIVRFEVEQKTWLVPYLAYHSAQEFQCRCQRYWVAANQGQLSRVLDKIDKLKAGRFLRHSHIKTMLAAISSEYARWHGSSDNSQLTPQVKDLLKRLKRMAGWKQQDFSQFNQAYIEVQLTSYGRFFASVESSPLTPKQRLACIIDDDNNLLLAGAGTGKTSVMVGRAGYLLASQQAKPEDILLLAYGQQAADEMDQRINNRLATDAIVTRTFHSLGLHIITRVEGRQAKLCAFAKDSQAKLNWVQDCFDSLIQDPGYLRLVLDYLEQYQYVEKDLADFAQPGQFFSYLKDNNVVSFKGDKVNGFAQLRIANWLFCHGIVYQYKTDIVLVKSALTIVFGTFEQGVGSEGGGQEITLYAEPQQGSAGIALIYRQGQAAQFITQLKQSLLALGVQAERLADSVIFASLVESRRISKLLAMLCELIGLYKGACFDARSQQALISAVASCQSTKSAFALLKPILARYQAYLSQRGEIDFDDMITKALSYIQTCKFVSPWSYIMIDEFQDISIARARLVKALRESRPGSSVFAVGDDWQAIYHFSGADLGLTSGFQQFFGATTQTSLDQTFRFNSGISRVATRFISKNPAQINKKIQSLVQTDQATVTIVLNVGAPSTKAGAKLGTKQTAPKEVRSGSLNQALDALANQQNTHGVSVYLLARYWHQLPDQALLAKLNRGYLGLTIKCQSFHGAKGKEADHVILLGMSSGAYGFPSQKTTAPIVDVMLAKQQDFAFAEERRLLYVALTRAKHSVTILADSTDMSLFVTELIEQEYDVAINQGGQTAARQGKLSDFMPALTPLVPP